MSLTVSGFGYLQLQVDGGTPPTNAVHKLTYDCQCTLNGNPVGQGDIHVGDTVVLHSNGTIVEAVGPPIVKVEATRGGAARGKGEKEVEEKDEEKEKKGGMFHRGK